MTGAILQGCCKVSLLLTASLYWLLGTSVREKGPLNCHCQPLSLCQVGLDQRSRRRIALVQQRKLRRMDSKPSGKAYKGCM
jgi:hypothetical protein